MKTYSEIEIEIGINVGESSTDTARWTRYTQDMRRDAIADTEIEMFSKANPAKFPKLKSNPLLATDWIASNILTLPDNLYRLMEFYHSTTAGVKTYFTMRDDLWEKLQDSINFTTADPYLLPYGERQYQLRHSISSPNVYYIIALKFPQTYDSSFDFEGYSQFEGHEETIINGATGKLLLKSNQPEKADFYLKLYQAGLTLLA